MNRPVLGATAVLCAVLAAGCGSQSTSKAAGTNAASDAPKSSAPASPTTSAAPALSSDPCTLLPLNLARTLSPALQAEARDRPDVCRYSTPDGASVFFNVTGPGGYTQDNAKDAYDLQLVIQKATTSEAPVPLDIGDEGVIIRPGDDTNIYAEVLWRRGDLLLQLQAQATDQTALSPDNTQPGLEAAVVVLAKKIDTQG